MFAAGSFNAKEFWSNGGLLLFPHVPKTGGTSIRRILSSCLADEVFLFETAVLEPFEYSKYMLRTTLPRDSSGIKLIIGHMPFGLHVLFPDRPVKYVSVVRTPLDRLASNYLHDYNHHVLLKHGDLLLSCNGLVEYADALRARSGGEVLTRFAHNQQCRILFPDLVEEIVASGGVPEDRDGFLQRVRALAEKWYVLIGAQERLGEFSSRLLALLGKGEPEDVHENTRYGSDSRQIFSTSDRATIEQWNEYDRLLFGFVFGESELAAAKKEPSEWDRMRLTADIRLKALEHCRVWFLALKEDRQSAQQIMNHQQNKIVHMEEKLLALAEDRQKAQQIMDHQSNIIIQLQEKLKHLQVTADAVARDENPRAD